MAAQVALRRQQEQEEELGISVPKVITTEQQQQLLQQAQIQQGPGSVGNSPTNTPLALLSQTPTAPTTTASHGRMSITHSPDILLYDDVPCKLTNQLATLATILNCKNLFRYKQF